jgi:hypothetical protein
MIKNKNNRSLQRYIFQTGNFDFTKVDPEGESNNGNDKAARHNPIFQLKLRKAEEPWSFRLNN